MNKNYNKGRNFEYEVKKYYEKRGYLVFRSAGSHSIADLIAIPKMSSNSCFCPVLIQCKIGKKHRDFKKDKLNLRKIEKKYFCTVALIVKINRKRFKNVI